MPLLDRSDHFSVKAKIIAEWVDHEPGHMAVLLQHAGVIVKMQDHHLGRRILLPFVQFFFVGKGRKKRLSIGGFQQRKRDFGVFGDRDAAVCIRFGHGAAHIDPGRGQQGGARQRVDDSVEVLRVVFGAQRLGGLIQFGVRNRFAGVRVQNASGRVGRGGLFGLVHGNAPFIFYKIQSLSLIALTASRR